MKFVQPKNIQDIFIRWNEFQPFEFTGDYCVDHQMVAEAYIQLELDVHEILGWIELDVNVKNLSVSEAEFFDRLNTTLKSKMSELEGLYMQIQSDFTKLRHLYNDACNLDLKYRKVQPQPAWGDIFKQHDTFTQIRCHQLETQIKRSLNTFHPVRMRMVRLVESHIKIWQPEQKQNSAHGIC